MTSVLQMTVREYGRATKSKILEVLLPTHSANTTLCEAFTSAKKFHKKVDNVRNIKNFPFYQKLKNVRVKEMHLPLIVWILEVQSMLFLIKPHPL